MASTLIDLSFLSENKSFALTVAQLQAMDKELQDIAARSPALIELSRAFGLTYANASRLTKELGLAPRELREAVSTMQSLRAAGADATTQYAVFAKQLNLTVEQMSLLADTVKDLGGSESVVQGLTQAFSSLFVLDKVNQFKASVFETGKVLETLQARLKTTLGTQASADDALSRIQTFAATTPFEMVEVTDAFVKLKQRGIDPTNASLKSLGDLAASQGKSLDQTTEALLDASQGEFERLKEFGIKASAAGDKVNVSFQGVNKQIERTPEGITAGILSLGALEGVAGGMEERAKTLGGAQSNLTDATTKLSGAAFGLVQGPAVLLIQSATKLIDTFFTLNPAIQSTILGVGVLGATFVSAVAAVSAFQAAQIGSALATGYQTVLTIPATIAKAANTAATVLQALAEVDLTAKKAAGSAASVASAATTGVDTAAKAANAAATGTAGAASAAANPAFIATAVSLGAVAAIALTAAAALALVGETYLKSTEGERKAEDASASLDKSLKAVEEGAKKRVASAEAAAKATADGLSATKKNALEVKELAATNNANDATIKADYNKRIDEQIGGLERFLDKVREFLNLPAEGFARTFELTAKLPLPGVVQDFLKGAAESVRKFKLGTTADAAKESDVLGFSKMAEEAERLGDVLNATKKAAGGKLGDSSKQEVEGLVNGYEDLIANTEKLSVANAGQQTQKDLLLRSLRKEQEEVNQGNKLIKEKEKRIQSVGTAESQWAAEVKKVTENLGKQIATSEDANKAIEITKKQLEAGFITPDAAQAVFQQIADYTQATGDVQIAASNEVNAVKAKQFDNQKALIENSIQLAELAGVREVTTATATAAEVAALRQKQAALEVQEIEEKIEALARSGRRTGVEGVKLERDLAKARIGQQKSDADAEVSQRADASAKINKALEDAATARAAAESKGAISTKGKVLASIKAGNLSIEDAEKEADKENLARQQTSLAAEIKLKQDKIQQLAAIGGKAAKDEAKKLGQEVLGLQEKQLDLEITAVKKAQKEKLDAIKEASDKSKALQGLTAAEDEGTIAQQELALYKDATLDKSEIDAKATELRLASSEKQLKAQLSIGEQELSAVRKAVADGVLSKKEGDKQIVQLETDLAGKRSGLTKNSLDQFKAAEAAKRAAIEETLRRQTESVNAAGGAEQAKGEAVIAQLKLANAANQGAARNELDRQIASKQVALAGKAAEDVLAIAKLEQDGVAEKISAGVISKKDADNEKLKSANAVSKAESGLIVSRAEQQTKAIEDEKQAQADAIRAVEAEAQASRAQAESADAEGAVRIAELRSQRAKATGAESLRLDEELIARRAQLTLTSAKAEAASAAEQEGIVAKRVAAGLIDAENAAAETARAATARANAQAKLIDATAEFELESVRKVERARQRAQQSRISNIELVKQALSKEQELISQSTALLSAQDGLESARAAARSQQLSFRKSEIDLAVQAAQAIGDTAAAEDLSTKAKQFELSVARAQSSEIARQFDIKLRNLDLDVESKRIAAEQLVLEKQIAVLEAEGALAAGKAEGKSAQELTALAQKVGFSKQALDLAERSSANTDKVAAIQKQTLGLERSSALQSNASQVQQLEGQAQIDLVKQGKASSGSLSGIIQTGSSAASSAVQQASFAVPAPDYKAVDTANVLLSKSLADLSSGADELGVTLSSVKDSFAQLGLGKLAGKRADGGPVGTAGQYLVGERGPELVTFAQQGFVHTAEQTSKMLRASASTVQRAEPVSSATSNEEVVRQLKSLNSAVSSARQVSPIEVPVNVSTDSADGVAMALAIVRADRAARYSSF